MKYAEMYPSNYLRAADFDGRTRTWTIKRIEMEEMNDGRSKPVLYFQQDKRGLVLNKSNGSVLRELFGEDTADWIDNNVDVYKTKVPFKGEMTDALRLQAPTAAAPF